MKKLLAALLMVPAVALAEEPYDYSFSIDTSSFQLLRTSVRNTGTKTVPKIVALWEVSAPPNAWRWSVTVNNCDKPAGTVQITYETGETRVRSWAAEGSRAYDHIAVNSCIAYYMGQKK
jgi:hypothetical protein